MDNRTPKDKLLDACGLQKSGVPSRPAQDQESKKNYEALLDRAENASARAQQAQDQTDQSYRRLNTYIREELPTHLVTAFEKVAQKEIGGRLRPLDDSVHNAACRIESCAEKLAGFSWNARIIWIAVLIGMATVSLGAVLVRWIIIEDKFDEERRYELYGREVAARMATSSPKDRERIHKWMDGGRLM